MTTADRSAYAEAGVDIAAGEVAVDLMRAAVESTRRPEVLGGIGGFAGAMALPPGLVDPVLVSATDGVGTKTAIARALGRYGTIGIDLVAMCADDVVCAGATPLFFLDYIAVGRVAPETIAEVVAGVAQGCRDAGCALVGGETAEHPGLMADEDLDLAGFCVGVVERGRIMDGRDIAPGDAILGLRSSGLHANGFSLVRAVVAEHRLDLAAPYRDVLRSGLGEREAVEALVDEPGNVSLSLGEVLLTPTAIYAPAVLALRDALEGDGSALGGAAHVTGGGLPGNVPRALPAGLGARLDPDRWRMPGVMRLVGALAGLDGAGIRATFNGGLGMVAVLPPESVPAAVRSLSDHGVAATLIGEVVPVDALAADRYVEGPLETLGDR